VSEGFLLFKEEVQDSKTSSTPLLSRQGLVIHYAGGSIIVELLISYPSSVYFIAPLVLLNPRRWDSVDHEVL
jgi:hypothetical protein